MSRVFNTPILSQGRNDCVKGGTTLGVQDLHSRPLPQTTGGRIEEPNPRLGPFRCRAQEKPPGGATGVNRPLLSLGLGQARHSQGADLS